jgi:hypothetical protein
MVQSQLIPENALQELRRWRLPLDTVEERRFETHDQLIDAIWEAKESGAQVHKRLSDLDLLERWRDPTQRQQGVLVLRNGTEKASNKITFCYAANGDIIIPWTGDSIVDLIINRDSYLRLTIEGKPRRVYFKDAEELFFGETKAFISFRLEDVNSPEDDP